MKYALFLQEIGPNRAGVLGRAEINERINKISNNTYEAIWYDDPSLTDRKSEVEVVVTSEHKIGEKELSPFPNIKMLSLAFTGFDDVDAVYCDEHKLEVYYAATYSEKSVAELTIALTLATLRRIPQSIVNIRNHHWDCEVANGNELCGKRVGILGLGSIGVMSANLFRAFGCHVVGWSRTVSKDHLLFQPELDTEQQPHAVFRNSDVVVLHLPLTKKTQRIIGSREFGLMKKSAVLINTARAGLVDNDALYSALKNREISAAGIDVYDIEPPNNDPLISLDNVIATPHIGFKTHEAWLRLTDITIENIGHYCHHRSDNRLEIWSGSFHKKKEINPKV